MTALLVAEISIPIDSEYIARAADNAGTTADAIVRELAQTLAFRLADEIRWKDGVLGPDVRVVVRDRSLEP